MPRIYLDTNVWGRPFDDQSHDRIREETVAVFKILEEVHLRRRYDIISSLILEDESEQIEGKEKREAVKAIIDLFITKTIDKFSESLYREIKALGLKDKDAMHLAFAVGNSDYFITCDDEMLKRRNILEEKHIGGET